MSLPLLDRAEVLAIRTQLGLTQATMADRIGVSRKHYMDIELGNALISPLIDNAVRWVEHVKGALPSNVCEDCEGRGTLRRTAPGQRNHGLPARMRCEACDGVGVARVGAAA